MVWLETPTERTLLLGSWVMAGECEFGLSTISWGLPTLPGVDNGHAIVNDHIATLNGAVGDQREVIIALEERDGPVHQVQVQVVELKLSQARVQRRLDNLRAVLAVPQLRGLSPRKREKKLADSPVETSGNLTMNRSSRFRPGTSWKARLMPAATSRWFW